MKIPREVSDALFAFCFYALLAGGARFFFGTIEGVALWRIVFFCAVVAWVHGYVAGGRPEGYVAGPLLRREDDYEEEVGQVYFDPIVDEHFKRRQR